MKHPAFEESAIPFLIVGGVMLFTSGVLGGAVVTSWQTGARAGLVDLLIISATASLGAVALLIALGEKRNPGFESGPSTEGADHDHAA